MHKLFSYLIVCLLIAGCASTTNVPAPTLASAPTALPTNTVTSTATISPTITTAPLVLDDFVVQMEGVGEHGNMSCVEYQGDPTDLEGLTLKADISQGDKVLDTNVPLEAVDGRSCFEMIDAKYSIGEPVTIEIIQAGDNIIINGDQGIELGNYVLVPTLLWYFGESDIARIVNFPNPRHEDAYDISGTSEEYPQGKDHPVNSPCTGQVLFSGEVTLAERTFHNFWISCSYTGFLVQLGHMEFLLKTEKVKANEIIGRLYPDEGTEEYYHTHTKVVIPPNGKYNLKQLEYGTILDIFNPAQQLGGEKLNYGLWISESLPQQVKDLIDVNVFRPNYDLIRYLVPIY